MLCRRPWYWRFRARSAAVREAAETYREQIPRIFPGNEVRVPAAFCGELQSPRQARTRKDLDL